MKRSLFVPLLSVLLSAVCQCACVSAPRPAPERSFTVASAVKAGTFTRSSASVPSAVSPAAQAVWRVWMEACSPPHRLCPLRSPDRIWSRMPILPPLPWTFLLMTKPLSHRLPLRSRCSSPPNTADTMPLCFPEAAAAALRQAFFQNTG